MKIIADDEKDAKYASQMTILLNNSPIFKKMIKKAYGKNLSREIAFGRSMVKFMKDLYSDKNELD